MCGIFGYLGERKAEPLLIEGLKKLEYRGYDSSGICVLENGSLQTIKAKGRVGALEEKPEMLNLFGNLGIAHTRWATHGEPSEINAHPHLDCQGKIAVVHNGIIENYAALKAILETGGHKFVSATDTEVVSHLIEKFYSGDLETAVLKSLSLLEGTFGLAVVCADETKIVVARKGSPLVLGIGIGEIFVASDASAILPYTKKVVYLEDKEMAILLANSFLVKNFDGKIITKEIEELKWTVAEIEKKGFKHFMLKEIFEQPQAIENTLRGRLIKLPTGDWDIKISVNLKSQDIQRIILLACGTSYYSGLIGKILIERIAGIPVEVDYASEFRYREPIVKVGDLAVVISQSGETADTLAALREAKARGAQTLGIVNTVGSTIAREVDSGIFLHAGPEIGVASTKAFTCQITALALLALYLQKQKNGRVNEQIIRELLVLPAKIQKILNGAEKIKEIAEQFKNVSNFLYLGRGPNFPTALEGALKLKEISYIHAEGYSAAEMKHGPIALVDENMPVVFVAPKDSTFEKILSNMQEIKARKGRIICLTDQENNDLISRLADFVIQTPSTFELLSPIINVIPLQLLAYYIADLKGIDVDKPRNLAKSVTVE